MNLTPVQVSERITLVDVLRGLAVLGIFLVNVPEILKMEASSVLRVYEGVDSVIKLLYDLLIKTKFYSIFSFLFGFGFWIFMSRAEAGRKNAKRLYLRRSGVLLLFGLAHAILFWSGDILQTYAVLGLGLFFFYRRKIKTMLIWAFSLMVVYWAIAFVGAKVAVSSATPITTMEPFNALDGYFAQLVERVTVSIPFKWLTTPVLIFELLPLFLFGLAVAKSGVLTRVSELKGKFIFANRVSAVLTLVLSIPILWNYFTAPYYSTLPVLMYVVIQGKAIAVFYITSCALLYESKLGRRLLAPFSYVGRMALTNYIMHSALTVIFVSLVVENTASLPLWQTGIYCVIVYILQVVFSKLWLSRYEQGPMEWLWRKGTYGFKPNLNIKSRNEKAV